MYRDPSKLLKFLPPRSVSLLLATGVVCRWVWAARIPLGNDEAYYWDWGRHLMLSYFDHPPGVAWVARAGSLLFGGDSLGARGLVPLMHVVATLALASCVSTMKGELLTRGDWYRLLLVVQVVPIFGLGGFLLMPDAGLLMFLSVLAAVGVKRLEGRVNFWHGIYYGCTSPRLGIGATSPRLPQDH